MHEGREQGRRRGESLVSARGYIRKREAALIEVKSHGPAQVAAGASSSDVCASSPAPTAAVLVEDDVESGGKDQVVVDR